MQFTEDPAPDKSFFTLEFFVKLSQLMCIMGISAEGHQQAETRTKCVCSAWHV